ncbi:MAG: phosphatase PAP2 family protein [Opitutaceae bacterium]
MHTMMSDFLPRFRVFCRRHKRFVFSTIVFVFAVWVFLELADDAPEGDYLGLEEPFMLMFREKDDVSQAVGPWWVTEAARDITALGGTAVLTLMTVLVLGYLLLHRKPRSALLVLVAVVGGTLLNVALKAGFGRARPDFVPHLAESANSSFPSGHSMAAATIYLTLGALLSRTVTRQRERAYLIATALLLSFLVGFTRVFLGVHYPTDVMAGWAAGTAWALLCWDASFVLQQLGLVRPASES